MNILKLFSKTSFNVPEMNHFRASKLRFIFKKAGRINDWIRLKLCQTSSLWFIQWQKNWFKVMPVECESQWGGRVGRTLARTHAHTLTHARTHRQAHTHTDMQHSLAHTNTYTGNTCNEHAKRTAGLEGRELLGVANCWRWSRDEWVSSRGESICWYL